MGEFSLLESAGIAASLGADLTDSRSTDLTFSGANTKNSWQQLAGTPTLPISRLNVSVAGSLITASFDALVDIGYEVGGGGTVTVLPNLLFNCKGLMCQHYSFPLSLPALGTVWARGQASAAAGVLTIGAIPITEGFASPAPFNRVTDYGPDTTDSGGVSVDPGGSANTKGAYSEVIASTANPIKAIIIAFGGQSNSIRTTAFWLVDIAKGAGGSEEIIVPNIQVVQDAGLDSVTPIMVGPFPVDIPAGTRLAARAQCGNIDATDRLLDVAIYGLD